MSDDDAESGWWREGVLYQVYVRSFADSDGDGVGDLRGVTARLDHLAWLGVAGIWLSPIHPSPNVDWGYDVADHRAVAPELGTLADLDELVARAGERGIRVILDLVANHTSDRHPWFVDSRSARSASHRGWYVWADPGPGGAPPNNWLDMSGAAAWEPDARTGQSYLHSFFRQQPDLDWWNPEVRDAFDGIIRFWLDRGIAGFRIDTANRIVKDRLLRDNPPARPGDPPAVRAHGQREVYNANRPEVHEVLRRWRRIADASDPPAILLGETWVEEIAAVAPYLAVDELHLAVNVPYLASAFTASTQRRLVADVERELPASAWPLWAASNHDCVRFPTRWGQGDPRRIRCGLLSLLTLRGTPLLYYGDEIGMPDTAVPVDRRRDPLGLSGARPGRDPARAPMRWDASPNAGFSSPGAAPWLPIGGTPGLDVAAQRADRASALHLCRDLIALRRERDALRRGAYRALTTAADVWAWRRGEGITVALNLGNSPGRLDGVDGRVLIGTDRGRDGEAVGGSIELAPWEGVVLSG